MSEKISTEENHKNIFFSVALSESILAIVLILSVLIMKFAFKKPYKDIKKWYLENIMVETDIEEIIDGAKNEN